MATQAEKERAAARQLRMKLRLESELRGKVRRLLGRQNARFLSLFQSTGLTLNTEEFRPELFNILLSHYEKAGARFQRLVLKEINRALKDAGERQIGENSPEMVSLLLILASSSARASVDQILGTSQRQILAALARNDRDAAKAFQELQAYTAARAASIAATETQKATEGTKAATVREAQGMVAGGLTAAAQLEAIKEWVPRNDSRVRPAHEAARFQRQPVRLPFVVGGELLMFPGDWSLGASPGNLVNCRCVALYTFGVLL